MATGQLNGVLRHVRRLANDVSGLSDGQLVERFRSEQDEAAFDGLVRRFGPLVLGVCRRVLGDRHDAEDAFQATFLVLVRKARSLSQPELVGNWLYGVAHFTARNLRASRSRRQAAERQVPAMPHTQHAEEATSDLQDLLDEELGRLPEKYRAPVVLCELHGQSRREAARQLGCNEGTLSSRLARARQMLRKRLARRGLALTGAMLAAGTASASVPTSLTMNTVQAAMNVAAGQAATAVVSAQVAALSEGVIKAMFLSKLKIVTAVCLVLGLLTAGAGVFISRALADKQPATGKDAPPAVKKGEEAPKKNAEADKGEKKEQGPTVAGILEAVDAGKNTIKVAVRVEGTKQTEEKTFDLAKDVKVLLNDLVDKGKEPEQGKVADLPQGTTVGLLLSADKKAVVAIHARGPGLQGNIKSVDAGKNTITINFKDGKGTGEKTIELAKGVKIMLNDGLKKSDLSQEGKLGDLAEGTPVGLQLSVDQKRALAVKVHGKSVLGDLKGVDVGNNTITITMKEDGQIVEKTFSVHKDARVEGGKLADLTAGTQLALTLSVFDQKAVVVVQTREKKKDKEDE